MSDVEKYMAAVRRVAWKYVNPWLGINYDDAVFEGYYVVALALHQQPPRVDNMDAYINQSIRYGLYKLVRKRRTQISHGVLVAQDSEHVVVVEARADKEDPAVAMDHEARLSRLVPKERRVLEMTMSGYARHTIAETLGAHKNSVSRILKKGRENYTALTDKKMQLVAVNNGTQSSTKMCSEPGCFRKARAHGLCRQHYKRLYETRNRK